MYGCPAVIYTTNWHTSYAALLSMCFDRLYVLRGWDADQRDIPANVVMVRFRDLFLSCITRRGVVLVSNNVPRDFFLILCVVLLGGHVVGVVHGQAQRGGGVLRTRCKIWFYRFLGLILGARLRYVCIQQAVKDSFGFAAATVIEPAIEFDESAQPFRPSDRFVVVANDFSRAHFSKALPDLLVQAGASVVLIGRGNRRFGECGYIIRECASQSEYMSELALGGVSLNILRAPEAPYNLGFIESISFGMPCVQLVREDMLPELGEAFFVYPEELVPSAGAELIARISDWLRSDESVASIELLQAKLRARFGFARFRREWMNAVRYD